MSYNSRINCPANYNSNDRSTDTNQTGKFDQKLPLKSIKQRRCLTKCYPKGQTYLHPVLLTAIGERTNNSCAIDPVHSRDKEYVKIHEMIWADTCRLEDNKLYSPPNELDSILLSFYFNPRDFLSSVYDLHSFDEVIYWTIDNEHLPFDTIKRVHNCAWQVYGENPEELSNVVFEYYYDIAIKYWLKDYIQSIRNDYSFDFISERVNGVADDDNVIYDILANRFLTYDFFVDALRMYTKEFRDKWEMVEDHYQGIKKFIYLQLIDRISDSAK